MSEQSSRGSISARKMRDGVGVGLVEEIYIFQEPLKFLSFDALDLARQLTLIDYKYFKMIEPREFIDSNWTKKEKQELSPNICKLAQWTSNASLWMASEVLSASDMNTRTRTLALIIQVASVFTF